MRFGFRTHPLLFAIGALAAVTQLGIVNAQSTTSSISQSTSASSSNSGSSSSSATSLSVTSSSFTSTITTTSNSQATTITTVIATNVTLTPTASTTTASASETSASATPIVLDTRIDPAYGVLGAVLIITGLPSAFWGHKNRWYVAESLVISMSYFFLLTARHLFIKPPLPFIFPIYQVILLLDRLLYLRVSYPCPHPEIWSTRSCQSSECKNPRCFRFGLFNRWNRGRWCRYLLLAAVQVLYRSLGRICPWFVDSVFPGRRSNPSYRIQVDHVYW